MATNWLTLTGADLLEVIAQVVHRKSNENVSPDIAVSSNPPTALDPDAPNRADRLAQRTVARIRGYVQKTGQQAVSVTPGTIPPDCWDAAADVAAWRLVVSTPGLQMAVLTEKGVYAPLQKRHDLGEEYLKRLAKGETVVDPTDPCGVDYATEVSDDNPLPRSVRWTDSAATDADYEDGQVETPEGVVKTLPVDEMRAD